MDSNRISKLIRDRRAFLKSEISNIDYEIDNANMKRRIGVMSSTSYDAKISQLKKSKTELEARHDEAWKVRAILIGKE